MNETSLVMLSSPGCHNCEAFLAFWKEKGKDFPHVVLTEVSLMSPEAAEYLKKYRVLASPGLIVNDQFFSAGPVDTALLTEKLMSLA